MQPGSFRSMLHWYSSLMETEFGASNHFHPEEGYLHFKTSGYYGPTDMESIDKYEVKCINRSVKQLINLIKVIIVILK